MKTLIATLAVIFTMTTSVTAGALDRLGNEPEKFEELTACAASSMILGQADDLSITGSTMYEFLLKPENEYLFKMVLDYADSEASKIRSLRNYGANVNTVMGMIDGGNVAYDMYMAMCVTDYFSLDA